MTNEQEKADELHQMLLTTTRERQNMTQQLAQAETKIEHLQTEKEELVQSALESNRALMQKDEAWNMEARALLKELAVEQDPTLFEPISQTWICSYCGPIPQASTIIHKAHCPIAQTRAFLARDEA